MRGMERSENWRLCSFQRYNSARSFVCARARLVLRWRQSSFRDTRKRDRFTMYDTRQRQRGHSVESVRSALMRSDDRAKPSRSHKRVVFTRYLPRSNGASWLPKRATKREKEREREREKEGRRKAKLREEGGSRYTFHLRRARVTEWSEVRKDLPVGNLTRS